MGKKTEITCACGCGLKRLVEVADVKRGWGKYLNKSHLAIDRNRKAGIKRRALGVGYKSKNNSKLFNSVMGLM